MAATVHIHRQWSVFSPIYPIRILLDGERVYMLSNGKTADLTVAPGEHELKLSLFLFSSTNRVMWEDNREYSYNVLVDIIGRLRFNPIS